MKEITMAMKKKAVAKKAPPKKVIEKGVFIVSTFDAAPFAGSDREDKLEKLRAEVQQALKTHFAPGATGRFTADFTTPIVLQDSVVAPDKAGRITISTTTPINKLPLPTAKAPKKHKKHPQ
jgi:hypothetical protein